MWYKVKVKLSDNTVFEEYVEADSLEEVKQIVFDDFSNQLVSIKTSLSIPPAQQT